MTLQKPNPSEEAALRNFSFDYPTNHQPLQKRMSSVIALTMNLPLRTPSTGGPSQKAAFLLERVKYRQTLWKDAEQGDLLINAYEGKAELYLRL